MLVPKLRITVLALVALVWSCSGTQNDTEGPERLQGESEEAAREARQLRGACEQGDREVTHDLNHDGTPEIREVYRGDQLICRETDLNFDGRTEIYRYYENGRQRREEMDLDRDGRLDLVTVFDQTGDVVVREEYDTNYDSRIDVWRFFTGEAVQRVERDSDHDGRADVWTHCASGRAVRLEFDTDGDGNPDDTQNLDEASGTSECARGELAETAPADPDDAEGEEPEEEGS